MSALIKTLLEVWNRSVCSNKCVLRLKNSASKDCCDKDGKLTVLKADMIGDTGAYASVGMKVLERSVGHAAGPYHIPNVDLVGKAAFCEGAA